MSVEGVVFSWNWSYQQLLVAIVGAEYQTGLEPGRATKGLNRRAIAPALQVLFLHGFTYALFPTCYKDTIRLYHFLNPQWI